MKPHLLLVEDDPVSLTFLRAALEGLPATVETAMSVKQAQAVPQGHDLWLIDANLPDGSGADLLTQLRAASPATPALAHTADDSSELARRLREAGFDGVVVKPITAAGLQAKVRAALGLRPPTTSRLLRDDDSAALPPWDDAAALAAMNGNRDGVAQLRKLFLAELPGQRERIRDAVRSGDLDAARHELHRLKAGSGFVGALRVQATSAALDDAPGDAGLLDAFELACEQTCAAS